MLPFRFSFPPHQPPLLRSLSHCPGKGGTPLALMIKREPPAQIMTHKISVLLRCISLAIVAHLFTRLCALLLYSVSLFCVSFSALAPPPPHLLPNKRGQVATQEEKDSAMDLIFQLEALNPTPDATNVNTIGDISLVPVLVAREAITFKYCMSCPCEK